MKIFQNQKKKKNNNQYQISVTGTNGSTINVDISVPNTDDISIKDLTNVHQQVYEYFTNLENVATIQQAAKKEEEFIDDTIKNEFNDQKDELLMSEAINTYNDELGKSNKCKLSAEDMKLVISFYKWFCASDQLDLCKHNKQKDDSRMSVVIE